MDKLQGAERKIIGQRQDIIQKQAKDLKTGKRKIAESFNNGAPERNNGFSNVSADITAPATDAAKQWDGWGSALKPANEPIVLARKPLEKGLSIAENVLKWGTGGINVDGCRVKMNTNDFLDYKNKRESFDNTEVNKGWKNSSKKLTSQEYIDNSSNGRFPANLILSHSPMCKLNGLKKVKGMIDKPTNRTKFDGTWNEGNTGLRNNTNSSREGYADENGKETIEDWTCQEDCPIRIMDEQSGILKSGQLKSGHKQGEGMFGKIGGDKIIGNYGGDSGGASRFFYCAKASKSERNNGLNGFEEKESKKFDGGEFNSASTNANERTNKNFHPTVKPVKLMQYLVRLITPPNGIVLDPFCGSGTTGIACKLEGFEFVGMEQDAEYCKIAEARIQNYQEEPEEPLKFIEEESKPKVIQQTLF
jgi:site-specific DNA-methyltransferase (adenine-specific)